MNAAILSEIAANQINTSVPEGCTESGTPVKDGTGAHLGLRDPWWNSGIHDLTDTTWFRWICLFVVLHYIYTNFLE